MSRDQSFDDLMSRLQAGDQDAAAEIFLRFKNRLIALARSRLDDRVRQKIDPEDVVNSAYKSFFVRVKDDRLEPDGWETLWSLLAVITMRKCGHQVEYYHAARRDIGRECTLHASSEDSIRYLHAIARDPTPAEAAVLTETVEQLMHRINPREQEIVARTLQGHSPHEISEQLGCSERTVRRVLAWVRSLLESSRDGNGRSAGKEHQALEG